MTLIGLPAINSPMMYDPEPNRPALSVVLIHHWVRHGLGILINAIKNVFREKITSNKSFLKLLPQMSSENIRRLTSEELQNIKDLPGDKNSVDHLARIIKGFFIIEQGKIVRVRSSDASLCDQLLGKLDKQTLVKLFIQHGKPDDLSIRLHNDIFSNNALNLEELLKDLSADEKILFLKNGAELAVLATQKEWNSKQKVELWRAIGEKIRKSLAEKDPISSQDHLIKLKFQAAFNVLATAEQYGRPPEFLYMARYLVPEDWKNYTNFLISLVDKTLYAQFVHQSVIAINGGSLSSEVQKLILEIIGSIQHVHEFAFKKDLVQRNFDDFENDVATFKRNHQDKNLHVQLDRLVSEITSLRTAHQVANLLQNFRLHRLSS